MRYCATHKTVMTVSVRRVSAGSYNGMSDGRWAHNAQETCWTPQGHFPCFCVDAQAETQGMQHDISTHFRRLGHNRLGVSTWLVLTTCPTTSPGRTPCGGPPAFCPYVPPDHKVPHTFRQYLSPRNPHGISHCCHRASLGSTSPRQRT